VSSFTDLWERRERAARELLHAERAVETYVDDEDAAAYEDIFGVPRNRLRFDDFEGVAIESTSSPKGPSGSSLGPLRRSLSYVVPRSLRACMRGCTCSCARCVHMRERPSAHTHGHTST